MIINIDNLKLRYKAGTYVLDQLDLKLDAGSITVLAAPNGEGKTSLLKVLCGLRFPNEGTVKVLGFDPKNREVEFLQKVYYLPAEPTFPGWTPQRIGKHYGAFYPNFEKSIYQQCLKDFSVDTDKSIKKLSFGQQRRVQLAFALATRVELLLLDEPTLGLDIAGKDQFRRSLIAMAAEGQTVIIATHQLAEVAPVLDQMLILREKQIQHQFQLQDAFEQLSFQLTSQKPVPFDGSYGRRVPGGWLVIKNDGSISNAQPDLETLYLALTEGNIKLFAHPKTNNHV